MTINRLAIEQEVIRQTRWGLLLTATDDGSTTTFKDNSSRVIGGDTTILAANAPLEITSSHANGPSIGAISRITSTAITDAGVIEVAPALHASNIVKAGQTAIVLHPLLDHPDRLHEAVNRALTKRCSYWGVTPCSILNDSDMQKTFCEDWPPKDANTARTKEGTAFPNTFGQSFMRVVNSAANGYVYQAVDCKEEETYHLFIIARAYEGTVEVTVYDATGSAAITLSGDDNTTTAGGWTILRFSFDTPASCRQFQVRAGASGASDTADYMMAILWPADARFLPLQTRVRDHRMISNEFFYLPDSGTDPEDATNPARTPLSRGVELVQTAQGLGAQFDSAIGSRGPVLCEEKRFYLGLGNQFDSTPCPDEYAIAATAYEMIRTAWLAEERPGDLPKPEGYANPFNGTMLMVRSTYEAAHSTYGATEESRRRSPRVVTIA